MREKRSVYEPTSGVLGIGPLHILGPEATASEMGEAALAAFRDCLPDGDVPWPTDWDTFSAPLIEALGLPWDDYMVGASCVTVTAQGGDLVVQPNRTHAPHGFVGVAPEKYQLIPMTSSPAEIGAAIERAFALCEVGPPEIPPLPG